MTGVALALIGTIIGVLVGAASRSCNCCNRYGHAWRKPNDHEDPTEPAICDRCGEYSSDHKVIA